MTSSTRTPTGQDLVCLVCRTDKDIDIDHVVNRGMGGSKERDVPENKVPLCRGHHEAKTRGTLETRIVNQHGGYRYQWRRTGSGVWLIDVPVEVSNRYKCLVLSGEVMPDEPHDRLSMSDVSTIRPFDQREAGRETGPVFGDNRLPKRFWSKAHVADNGCWEWTGTKYTQGYGSFIVDGRRCPAHRVAYETLVGPIPEGLECDHLCRNRPCVNPAHIEPVTSSVNTLRGDHAQRRKTHCPQGHPYDEENTVHYRGQRGCRACDRERRREARRLGVAAEGEGEGKPVTSTDASAPSLSVGQEESDGGNNPKRGDDTERNADSGGLRDVSDLRERSDDTVLEVSHISRGDNVKHERSNTTPLTQDQRAAIAAGIKEMEWGRQWLAGDTANEWEEELGERFWNEWANEFGYTYPSLRNNQRVCKAVPPPFRHEMLRFSHHVVVADLNREDMEMWLHACELAELSVAEFRRQVKGERPRVKRWDLQELQLSAVEWIEDALKSPPPVEGRHPLLRFLDWLGEQA